MKYLLLVLLAFVPSSVYAFTYENHDLNIRMWIPDDWVYREFSGSRFLFQINIVEFAPALLVEVNHNNESIESPVLMTLQKDINPPYKNTPLELYKEYLMSNNYINDSEIKNITIGKEDLKAYRIEKKLPSFNMISLINFLVYDGQPYLLSFIGEQSYHNKYYPIFQNITKSIEFLN